MQIHCRHCNRPYAMKREEVEAVLTNLFEEGLKYHNSSCPHCGKNNRVTKKQLRRSAPGWKPPQAQTAEESPQGDE